MANGNAPRNLGIGQRAPAYLSGPDQNIYGNPQERIQSAYIDIQASQREEDREFQREESELNRTQQLDIFGRQLGLQESQFGQQFGLQQRQYDDLEEQRALELEYNTALVSKFNELFPSLNLSGGGNNQSTERFARGPYTGAPYSPNQTGPKFDRDIGVR